jgi:hypothetical protein
MKLQRLQKEISMRGIPWKLRFRSDVDPGPRTQMHTYLQYLNTSLQSIQYGLQTLFVRAFKCKQYHDGSDRKLKARFCVCGDKQVEGVDYFDNYAPVVTRTIVQILLILSSILGLATTQVDYTVLW